MRSFYVLGLDPSRRDLQAVVEADYAGFNTTLLARGERIQGLPAELRLYVSNKKRTHSLGNGVGWQILSDDALAVLREFVPADALQVLSLPLFDFKTRQPVMGYSLVNCLRVIRCLTYDPGDRLIYAHRVVVRDSCIPGDTHLFRLGEEPRHWIITEQLWHSLSQLDGFDATTAENVSS